MKNQSLVFNVLLSLAVIVLFVLHFTGKKENNEPKKIIATPRVPKDSNAHSVEIAYVDLDSLNDKIPYIKNKRKELEAEQEAIEKEWESGYKGLENQKNEFLKKGSSITQDQAESFQANLMQQQEQIDGKKQMQTQKFRDKSYKFLDDIQLKLKNFLKEYNQNGTYSYIFTTGNGMDYIVYKDSAYNITDDVIQGMNQIFETKQK